MPTRYGIKALVTGRSGDFVVDGPAFDRREAAELELAKLQRKTEHGGEENDVAWLAVSRANLAAAWIVEAETAQSMMPVDLTSDAELARYGRRDPQPEGAAAQADDPRPPLQSV
jgi:hypothetical protein